MSRKYVEVTQIDSNICFECGAPATERHHIIPASLGGTKTIPLCGSCHAKVHDIRGKRRNQLAELTRSALAAKKQRGEIMGGAPGVWGKRTGKTEADREKQLESARAKMAECKRAVAQNNPHNKAFWKFITDWQKINGVISRGTSWIEISDELNRCGMKTSSGMEFTEFRARAMYSSMKRIFRNYTLTEKDYPDKSTCTEIHNNNNGSMKPVISHNKEVFHNRDSKRWLDRLFIWGKNTNSTDVGCETNYDRRKRANNRIEPQSNIHNKKLWEFMNDWQRINGEINRHTDWDFISEELNKKGLLTSSGLLFTASRARSMWNNVKRYFDR